MQRSPDLFFSKELQLILSCLADSRAKVQFDDIQIDPERLIDLIETHRVVSFVYETLKKSDKATFSPSITHDFEANKIVQLQLSAEMLYLKDAFDEQHIPVVCLKGPALGIELYSDPTARSSRDLDFLIEKKDIEKSIDLLRSLGYVSQIRYRTVKQYRALIDHFHHIVFVHPEKNTLLELHWELSTVTTMNLGASLWTALRNIPFQHLKLSILHENHNLLYLCVHGAKHGYFRLQWAKDIHSYLKKYEKEEIQLKTVLLAKEKNLVPVVLSTFQLIHTLFGQEIHADLQVKYQHSRKSKQLHALFLHQIKNNTSPEKSFSRKARFQRFWNYHRLNFLIGGFPDFFRGLIGRNVRPQNWEIFVFSDRWFFLNQWFSRFIWLYGMIRKKKL